MKEGMRPLLSRMPSIRIPQQILLIIEKIHHLADRGLIAGLDLHQANDIQCILSYQCEIVSGASGR